MDLHVADQSLLASGLHQWTVPTHNKWLFQGAELHTQIHTSRQLGAWMCSSVLLHGGTAHNGDCRCHYRHNSQVAWTQSLQTSLLAEVWPLSEGLSSRPAHTSGHGLSVGWALCVLVVKDILQRLKWVSALASIAEMTAW